MGGTGQETPTPLRTLDEAAAYLRMPVATLRYWRQRGEGPASFRIGRRVIYRQVDLDAYVERQVSGAEASD